MKTASTSKKQRQKKTDKRKDSFSVKVCVRMRETKRLKYIFTILLVVFNLFYYYGKRSNAEICLDFKVRISIN